jgi:microcin C transport system permease protein
MAEGAHSGWLERRLSPLARRRWRSFKANKRGFYSACIFVVLFVFSLFAEIIANDKPILVYYDGTPHFPIFQVYPETAFGGEFQTEAAYREADVQDLIRKNGGWMVWPMVRFSYRTVNFDLKTPAPSPPTWENPLGTDDQGRDVFARVVYGFRISVIFGLTLTFFGSVLGIVAGGVQGYFGGWTDLLGQRFVEIWNGLPNLFLLIILASMFEPSFLWLLGIMILFGWTSLVGVVRAEFLRARNFDYVRAARSMGASNIYVMRRHIFPNAMVATLTFMPFILNGSITTLTSLDFLGFGLPPGSPSLGELLAQGKNNIQAPWLGFSAFTSLAVTLSLLIFVGEAVRDAYDPRKSTQ